MDFIFNFGIPGVVLLLTSIILLRIDSDLLNFFGVAFLILAILCEIFVFCGAEHLSVHKSLVQAACFLLYGCLGLFILFMDRKKAGGLIFFVYCLYTGTNLLLLFCPLVDLGSEFIKASVAA